MLLHGTEAEARLAMAYIPGYEHDIFVSYAHVDDQPFLEAAPGREGSAGWVSNLVRLLKDELARKIGRPDGFSVWFDAHHLRGHHTLTEEIAARLQQAAILIAVLSPGYVASRWCQEEARLFCGRFGPDLSRRVFLVEREPLDDDMPPPAGFADRRKYQFWFWDRAGQPRTFAVPVPHTDEMEYYYQIEDMARDLRDQFRVMRAAGPAPGPTVEPRPAIAPVHRGATANGAVAVFLAEVADDLEFRRAGVRRYLDQQGFRTLPVSSYPPGRAEFEEALDADLADSRLFVQLLGPTPEKRPRDVPDGYGWLQLEAAKRHALPILQWRSPEIDLDSIEWPRHRELLGLETVRATTLESFKAAIVAALAPPPPAPEPRRDGTGRPLIFLNAEPRYRALAAEIQGSLAGRAEWREPPLGGSSAEMRQHLEQNIIDCDAMVVVYADNLGWARAQLLTYRKLAPKRVRPVRALPIIDAPPQEKPDLGFFLPEMMMIDGRRGIGPDVVAQLSASLRL